MERNDKKTSKAIRRKKAVRVIQAVIVIIIVLGMIVTGILAYLPGY